MKCSLHPIYYASVSLVVIFTGGLASLYADDIKSAFPFVIRGPWLGLDIPAIAFWLLAVSASTMLAVRQFSVDKARALAQAELRQEAQALRTMPPATFMSKYARMVALTDQAVSEALSSDDRNALQQTMRYLLKSIAVLARSFDGDPLLARYAANVMIFYGIDDLTDVRRDSFQSHLSFCEEGTQLESLTGVLVLDPSHSATADSDDYEPDVRLDKPLILPLPKRFESPQRRMKVLPGAPYSFYKCEVATVPDTNRIGEWFKDYADITMSVQSQMSEYFLKKPEIRSFVSMPITGFNELDESKRPVAILNIHSNIPGLLRTDTTGNPSFQFVLAHHFTALVKILNRMVELNYDTPFVQENGPGPSQP